MAKTLRRYISPACWLYVLLAALLLFHGRQILAVTANNLASLDLQYVWDHFYLEADESHCGRYTGSLCAERYADAALVLSPDYARALANQGRVNYLIGNCSEALVSWQRVLQLSPTDSFTAVWLYWARDGDPDRIPRGLSRELLAKLVADYGHRALSNGAKHASMLWYEASFNLRPSQLAAVNLRALQDASSPDFELGLWQRVVATQPVSKSDYWWAKGMIAALGGKWTEAVDAFVAGSELALSPYDFWMQEGLALEKLNRLEQAEIVYRRAVSARSELATAYANLGNLRFQQQDYRGAIDWYRQALLREPHRTDLFYFLGVSLYRLGDDVAAERDLRRFLADRPDYMWANYYLAQILHGGAAGNEAATYLSRAVALSSQHPWEWAVQLGDWQLALGDKDAALASYRQALAWNPALSDLPARINELSGHYD